MGASSSTAEGGLVVVDLAEKRIRARAWHREDVVELGASVVAAFATTWLLFFRLTPLSGALGFLIVWYGLFLAIYAAVVWDGHGRVAASDRIATVMIAGMTLIALVPLFVVIGFVTINGVRYVRVNFFTETMAFAGGDSGLDEGGALHAIVGSAQQVGIAFMISVPLAVLTAIHLNEVKGRLAPVVRFFVDAMSGVPSIVAGLFVYSVLVVKLEHYSGIAAALALSVLMLPTVARTALEMLRLVPSGLREAALALGAPEWRVALRVVVPTARTGLVTAAILGTARVLGETAPVLLTALGSKTLQLNPFAGPQSDLPLYVWENIRSSEDVLKQRAYAGAFVLLVMVLTLFGLARLLASRRPGGRGRSRRWRSGIRGRRRIAALTKVVG